MGIPSTSPPAVPAFVVPAFVVLGSHPVRWRLLIELVASDRSVSELTERLGRPQALVSYHLGRLRRGGLVTAKRSAVDGRAAYYRVRLDRCGELLREAGGALHPALGRGVAAPERPAPVTAVRGRRHRVLFACTGNASRSLIAEAMLRDATAGTVDVVSAGSHPKPVHPAALAVLAERGVDTTGLRSKPLTEFEGERVDRVITLCDRVREVCPEFGGPGVRTHWSIDDPARTEGPPERILAAMRAVADDLDARIAFLCAQLATDKEPRTHGR